MFYAPQLIDAAMTALNARFGDVIYPKTVDEPLLWPASEPRDWGHVAALTWLRREMPEIVASSARECESSILSALNATEGGSDEIAVWRRLPDMWRENNFATGNVCWRGTFRLEVYQMERAMA